MCFAPQRRAILGHRNYQKWPESVVFSTFWLTNMLRATAACHFSTSDLQKVVRTRQFFTILTWKCASRHSGEPFCRIATCKMGPALRCFVHFDAQMCFAPQRRGIFQHRNFQNGSANVVFCAFWLSNVLRATGSWHFSPSQLPKWLRECGVLHILTFKCAFRHSRVPFFTCPPNSSLRTRRFSEPTFRTSGTTIHWENTAIRDFTNIFRAYWTACEWLYTHVDLLASDLTDVDLLATDMTAVRLCFSTLHIVGS